MVKKQLQAAFKRLLKQNHVYGLFMHSFDMNFTWEFKKRRPNMSQRNELMLFLNETNPDYWLMNAFGWAENIKGYHFWHELNLKWRNTRYYIR